MREELAPQIWTRVPCIPQRLKDTTPQHNYRGPTESFVATPEEPLATMTEETPTKTNEVSPTTNREVSTKTSHIERILSVANREEHPELTQDGALIS